MFTDNHASNAGAVGALFAQLAIYNSLFQNNSATGNGANSNDPSRCPFINNDQNEIGSGRNGDAIDQDGGNATNVVLCGVDVVKNAAGARAFGGGVFMTSNDFTGTMTVQDSIITANTGGSWAQAKEGSVANLATAFGVNVNSATVQNSTLQGRRSAAPDHRNGADLLVLRTGTLSWARSDRRRRDSCAGDPARSASPRESPRATRRGPSDARLASSAIAGACQLLSLFLVEPWCPSHWRT